jgi:hypothetical protein
VRPQVAEADEVGDADEDTSGRVKRVSSSFLAAARRTVSSLLRIIAAMSAREIRSLVPAEGGSW